MENKIISNKAQCKDIIELKDTNDLKRCTCGSIAVDGGLEYIKRIGNPDDVIELSEYGKENSNPLLSSPLNSNVIKSDFPIVKFPSPLSISDSFSKNLLPAIKINNNFSDLIITNLSSPLQKFSESILESIKPSYFDFNHRLVETMKPIISMQNELISNIVKQTNPMQEIAKKLSEALKPITSQVIDSLPKMTSYFDELSKSLEKAKENPDSLLNWIEYSEKLSELFLMTFLLMN